MLSEINTSAWVIESLERDLTSGRAWVGIPVMSRSFILAACSGATNWGFQKLQADVIRGIIQDTVQITFPALCRHWTSLWGQRRRPVLTAVPRPRASPLQPEAAHLQLKMKLRWWQWEGVPPEVDRGSYREGSWVLGGKIIIITRRRRRRRRSIFTVCKAFWGLILFDLKEASG